MTWHGRWRQHRPCFLLKCEALDRLTSPGEALGSHLPSGRGRPSGLAVIRPMQPRSHTIWHLPTAFANGIGRSCDTVGYGRVVGSRELPPGVRGARRSWAIGQVRRVRIGVHRPIQKWRVRYAHGRLRCIFHPWQMPVAMAEGHFRASHGPVSGLNPPRMPTRPCGSASSGCDCASCALGSD